MLVDLAHVSTRTSLDVLSIADVPPVIVSHTGVFAICEKYRNIEDEVLLKVVGKLYLILKFCST